MLEVASTRLKGMVFSSNQTVESDERDAIDSYFECVTACSIEGEGVECVTRCVEVHLKEDSE